MAVVRIGALALLFALGTAGCGIGLKVATTAQFPSLGPDAPAGVVEAPERLDTTGMQRVGTVVTRDKGLTVRCDYASVLDTVRKQARSLGANVVRVDEHLTPSPFGSSCHRVRATLFRAEDARPFEKQLPWSATRRLTIAEFKGDTSARPFQAATLSLLGCAFDVRWGKVTAEVNAWFDCHGSYFKRGPDDGMVLAHEQLHFDLTELHARLLRQRIAGRTFAPATAREEIGAMHAEEMRLLLLEQDHYDADVRTDPTAQVRWSSSVAGRLAALSAFAPVRVLSKTR
ncbi:MAG: hypothetical protein JST66_13075 [Bacteroidetes bacterium]|nr:hypothetical protein [Bacteroidota bacterium]